MIKPEVFEAVQRERQWQLTKHKKWHDNPSADIKDWLIVFLREAREVDLAVTIQEELCELLQVITVGCAILSHFGVVERNYASELTALQNTKETI